MKSSASKICISLLLAAGLLPGEHVGAVTRADCDAKSKVRLGQAGKDVIWLPSQAPLVVRMLQMANVTPEDHVFDLGAGDGKIPIIAAKQFGARGTGIELDAKLVSLARCLVQAEGVADRVDIVQGDIFASDFSNATVVTLYLLDTLNVRLRPQLLDLRPGTRIVSHRFGMGEWRADAEVFTGEAFAYLWIVPAKVAGTWSFRSEAGDTFLARFTQHFQDLSGSLASPAAEMLDGTIAGSQITFRIGSGDDARQISGRVAGDRIDAVVSIKGNAVKYVALKIP